MSSLGEIQQMVSALQEIDGMVGKLEVKLHTLSVEAGHARGTLNEIEYIFYRVTSILGRMGLPKEIDAAIMKIQRLILIVRMLTRAMEYIHMTSPELQILGWLNIISTMVIANATEVSSR